MSEASLPSKAPRDPPNPSRTAPSPMLARLARGVQRTDLALATSRVVLLGVAGLVEGLLLADSPVLERYSALRLGPEGILVDLSLLCAAVLGALGCAAAFAAWSQAVFLGFVVATASWSLAESSLHPFWIFSNKGVWRPHPPSAGVVAAHVVAISFVCAAALLEAMQRYRRAAREQAFAPADLDRDTKRLALGGAGLLGATAAVTVPVIALLDGAADELVGAVRGRTAFTVLMASALLLLVGLGLLAAQGRAPGPRQAKVAATAKPAAPGAKADDKA